MPTKRKKPTRATKSIGTKVGAPEQRGVSVSESQKQQSTDVPRGMNRQTTPGSVQNAEKKAPSVAEKESMQNKSVPRPREGASQATPASSSVSVSAPASHPAPMPHPAPAQAQAQIQSQDRTRAQASVQGRTQTPAQDSAQANANPSSPNRKKQPSEASNKPQDSVNHKAHTPTPRKREKRQFQIPFFNKKRGSQAESNEPEIPSEQDIGASQPMRVPYRDPAPIQQEFAVEPDDYQTERNHQHPAGSRQGCPAPSSKKGLRLKRFADLRHKVSLPQFVIPSFQRGEVPPQKRFRISEFVTVYKNRILAVIFGLLVTALVATAGYMYWDYYYRYDDALDIQGPWHTSEGVPVFIDESNINMPDDVVYAYTINTKKKTITYTFAKLKGSGSYKFSPERNMLIITEGEGDDSSRVTLIRDTSKKKPAELESDNSSASAAAANTDQSNADSKPKTEATEKPQEPAPEQTEDSYDASVDEGYVDDSGDSYSDDAYYEDEYYEDEYYEDEYYEDEYYEDEYYEDEYYNDEAVVYDDSSDGTY